MAAKIPVPAKKKKGQTFSHGGKTYKVGVRKKGKGYVRVAVAASSGGATKKTTKRTTKGRRKAASKAAAKPSMRKAMTGKAVGARFYYYVGGRKYEGIVVSGKGGKKRGCKIRAAK